VVIGEVGTGVACEARPGTMEFCEVGYWNPTADPTASAQERLRPLILVSSRRETEGSKDNKRNKEKYNAKLT